MRHNALGRVHRQNVHLAQLCAQIGSAQQVAIILVVMHASHI